MGDDPFTSPVMDLTRAEPCPPADENRQAACVWCGDRIGRLWYEKVRDRLGYVKGERSFGRCSRCGSAVLVPMPGAGELAAFYPPVYCFSAQPGSASRLRALLSRVEDRLLYQPIYASDARRILKAVHLSNGAGKRLLDIGCGRGGRLLALRARGFEVTGVDFDREAVDALERLHRVPAYCCEVLETERILQPGSFDIITAYHLLEHAVAPVEVVKMARRLLKPGGYLIVAVPLVDSIQSALFSRHWCHVTEAPRHVSLPSQQGMRFLAREAGFEVEKVSFDSLRCSAASMALSLVPRSATSSIYGRRSPWAIAARAMGIIVAAGSYPFCYVESKWLKRPTCGLFLLQSPGMLR